VREKVRQTIGPEKFIEIFVTAPIEVCKERDRSGLYAMAERGEIAQFPGVSAVFEEPSRPDLVLPTDQTTVEQSVEQILTMLRQRGFIS
jgi:adenylylsulfate kinase-like enzyme